MLTRLFHWICDACKKEVAKEGYKMPQGWVYLPNTITRRFIEHRCKECVEKEGLQYLYAEQS